MITDNGKTGKKRPLRVAIEDAMTIFLMVFIANLIAALPGFPSLERIYISALVGAGYGVAAWGKARNIQSPVGR